VPVTESDVGTAAARRRAPKSAAPAAATSASFLRGFFANGFASDSSSSRSVVNAGGAGEMLAWVMQADGMRAQLRDYSGFQNAGVDLLLVADEEGLAAMRGAVDGEALTIIKRQIRRGAIMFFVMRTKYELQDAGYEDLLDSLGLAFLGACR